MPKAQKADRPVLPSFTIAIGGDKLEAATAAHVVAVTIDQDVALPGMFSFDLVGSDDQKVQASWIDSDLFKIGRKVEVKLGYHEKVDSVMIGEITALEPEFGVDHLPNLTVRGFDGLHRLQRGRKTQTYTQQKDSDVASTIAGKAGLSADGVVDSGVTHDYLVQANQTNFEFLSERAAAIGYELRVDGEKLCFAPAQNREGAKVTLSLQSDLLEFHPRLTAARQVSDVSVRGWNVKEKTTIASLARAGDEVSAMGGEKTGPAAAESAFKAASEPVTAWTPVSQAEADRFTKGRIKDIALDYITGDGICWGRTDVRAGTVIEIKEIGKRFSGPYYVTRVKHRYSSRGGYVTEFSVRRNASS